MKLNNKGFTFIEILAVIAIIGILSGISIIGVSKYKESAKNKDYEALAKSSYSAMEEYMMANPYKKEVSLKTLDEGEFLSNRIDPATKSSNCEGSVKVEKVKEGKEGSFEDNKYVVYLCCTNYQKMYTYPDGEVKDIDDPSKCEVTETGSDDYVIPEPLPGEVTYNITYNLNGGTVSGNPDKYSKSMLPFPIKNPTRSGYTFDGWTGSNGTTPQTTVTLAEGTTGDKTYNAIWNKNTTPTKKYTCVAGKYLPGNKTTCKLCISRYYCPGGTWKKSSKDQGLYKCKNGYLNSKEGSSKINQCYMNVAKNYYVSKAYAEKSTKCQVGKIKEAHVVYYGSKSNCVDSTIKCNAGYYLPKSRTTCVSCTAGNYCLGGSFKYNTNNDQGLTKCPDGYNNSSTGSTKNTQCYINVPAKMYIKTKKSKVKSNCGNGTYKAAHTVYYGSTSKCNDCPTGYKDGAGTNDKSNCIMDVAKNKHVKKEKASTATKCDTGYVKDAHKVKYGNTSSCIKIPTCTIKPSVKANSKGWNNENVKIELDTSGKIEQKGLATSKKSTNGKTSVKLTTEGVHTYYGYVKGPGGSDTCSITVRIDKTKPVIKVRKHWEQCTVKNGNKIVYRDYRAKYFGFNVSDSLSGIDTDKTVFKVRRYYDDYCNKKSSPYGWQELALRYIKDRKNVVYKRLKDGDLSGSVENGLICGGTNAKFEYHIDLYDRAGNHDSLNKFGYLNQPAGCP